MTILGTYNSSFSTLILRGGYNCLLINSLYNFRGGFGFKTAASSCPDVMSRSGAGGVLFPIEQF